MQRDLLDECVRVFRVDQKLPLYENGIQVITPEQLDGLPPSNKTHDYEYISSRHNEDGTWDIKWRITPRGRQSK